MKYIVLSFTVLIYIPVLIGGYLHPSEINIASYGIWLLLSALFVYTQRGRGLDGWALPLGYVFGNVLVLSLAFSQGGYTWNLSEHELLPFLGLLAAVFVWLVHGSKTGLASHRVLFLGILFADLLSFYPIMKQFWGEGGVSMWTVFGWAIAIPGPAFSLLVVERFFEKWISAKSWNERLGVIEGTMLSIEQVFMITLTTLLMLR